MKYVLEHKETKETVSLTIDEVLELINRDRSEEWQDFNAEDWQEGLCFTEYRLITNISDTKGTGIAEREENIKHLVKAFQRVAIALAREDTDIFDIVMAMTIVATHTAFAYSDNEEESQRYLDDIIKRTRKQTKEALERMNG